MILDFLTLAKCETTPLFAHGKELAKLGCDGINRSPHRTRPAHASSESLAFFVSSHMPSRLINIIH
jgi:hypothetical protein